MKTLLINPPIRFHAPSVNFPLNFGYLASVMRENGCEVTVLELNVLRWEKEKVIKYLENNQFALVSVGGMITIWNYAYWLIQEIKRTQPQAKLLIGGNLSNASTNNPELDDQLKMLIMQRFMPDIMVTEKEAETAVIAIIKALQQGDSLSHVSGIWYLENGEIKKNDPSGKFMDINIIPYPAWDLFPMEEYIKYPRHESGFRRRMDIISSRGCPFTCKFCNPSFGRMYRFRSPENLLGEILELYNKYKIRNISFLDDHMTANAARMTKFCEKLIAQNLDLTWSCLGRVDSVNPPLLKLMKKSGCVYIGFGIESGSQKILDLMDKKVKVERAKEAVIMTREAGIAVNTTFMIGYPGETRETVMETVQFCRDVKINLDLFYANPYPGTELFNWAIKHEKIKNAEQVLQQLGDANEMIINLTEMTDQDLINLRKEALQLARMSLPQRLFLRFKVMGFRNLDFWVLHKLGFVKA